MLNVLFYFILNFILVYSYDIENVQYTRKRYIREQKGVCDLHTTNNQKASFNYNELFKKEGYTFTSGDKIFYLNICGNAPQCGRNVAVCYKNKINSKVINNIGLSTDITLAHEGIRYKISKGKKTQISFICDRHAKEPNILYDKDSKYTFKFITSKACYPKPTECVFNDIKYIYNISSLHRNYNNWVVRNVPNSNSSNDYKMYLNICGKFNSIPNLRTDSDCFYDGTQICLVYNDGNSKNLGVFSDSFQSNDNNNSISLNIKGGSLCSGSNSIITNIEFICSIDEFGPVLVSNSNCEYNINWKTPAVCPHRIEEISNCKLKNLIFGSRKMKLNQEMIHLNSTAILKYNICDRISCNGDENVHFCLVNANNNKETIIGGSYVQKLISIDGLLTSTYQGDNCSSNSLVKNRVNMQLICDYTKHRRADVNMSEDSCVTNIRIYTSEVCTDAEPNILDEQCSTFLNKSGIMNYYNVSRLMLTDRNYEIKDDSDPNIVFILNVCQPILFRAETHCDPTAIVCMRNDSIGNIYEKSKTLGHYQYSKLIVLQNDSLSIQFEGSMCAKRMGNKYSAKIEFVCNFEAKDTLPTLVSNTDCEYYFKWETQDACPLINDTLHISTKEITVNNETPMEHTKNDEKVKESNVLQMKHTTAIVNHISTTTSTTTTTTTTIIAPNEDLIINKIIETTESSVEIPPTLLIVPIDAQVQVSNTSVFHIKNCTFEDFNMFTLPRIINITSRTGKLYSLNICNLPKNHDCRVDNCLSKLKRDSSNKFIELDFNGKTECLDGGYYNSVIYIKCSEKSSQPSVIKEEACGVEFEWENSAVCALLKEKPKNYSNDELDSQKSGHMTTIILSVFVLLLILCAFVFIFIYFWRKRQVPSSPSCLVRCEYSKIKDSSKIV